MEDLAQAWNQLCNCLGVFHNSTILNFYNLIERQYCQPHRYYHTLKHIDHCLKEFIQVRDQISSPNEVEMAIWFHDYIYETKSQDNELRSAEAAVAVAQKIGMREQSCSKIREMILATKHDVPTETLNRDTEILVDIDLSILGSSDSIFDQYEIDIRREYYWVEEKLFCEKRRSIIEHFLARPQIYATDYFKNKYEEEARRNLHRSRSQLL